MVTGRIRRTPLVRALPLVLLARCSTPASSMDATAVDPDAAVDAAPETSPDVSPDTGSLSDAYHLPEVPPLGTTASNGCGMDAGVRTVTVFQRPDAGVRGTFGLPPLEGPGGPAATFTADQLGRTCAHLPGGAMDRDHHNGVFMLDGYLYMPWAHEAGGGGITVFDVHDPCRPVTVGYGYHAQMRETHTSPVSTMNGRWTVTASLGGIQFWDLSDPRHPTMVTDLPLEGVTYPDAYRRVVFSTAWQGPYVYVGAADNGVFVVDATDPRSPRVVNHFQVAPVARVGLVQIVGNLLVTMGIEGSRTTLLDAGDPVHPVPIVGGSWQVHDGTMLRGGGYFYQSVYFGRIHGNRAYYARNALGGGLIVYDFADWTAPRFLGAYRDLEARANGGYVFLHEGTAFVGLSARARTLDVRDPANLTVTGTYQHPGDLDFAVPLGNTIVLSVDEGAPSGQATAIQPRTTDPDRRGPVVNMVVPRDGAMAQALTTRVGVTFDELVEPATVAASTFVVRRQGAATPVDGWYSVHDEVVNFFPSRPLEPGATYELTVPAGGITDVSGNPTTASFRATFRATDCR